MWQIDCDEFRKVGRRFELRDVTTAEHEQFITAFCQRYPGWTFQRNQKTVTFTPPIPPAP